MNKILLDNQNDINNLVIEEDSDIIIKFDNTSNELNIIIEDNVCVNIIEFVSNTSNKIVFTLKENSRLLYNKAAKNSNDTICVNLDGKYSSVVLNNSVINYNNSINNYEIIHNNISTTSSLSNHGINNSKDNLIFNVNAIIKQNGVDSKTNQENKIINTNIGKSNIYPNLIVDIDEVDASHSAYISDVDSDSIFYMNSRGIDTENARNLLIQAFLLGNLEGMDNYIEDIKRIFNFK